MVCSSSLSYDRFVKGHAHSRLGCCFVVVAILLDIQTTFEVRKTNV
jgi:uncharacterized membrane protein YwzB